MLRRNELRYYKRKPRFQQEMQQLLGGVIMMDEAQIVPLTKKPKYANYFKVEAMSHYGVGKHAHRRVFELRAPSGTALAMWMGALEIAMRGAALFQQQQQRKLEKEQSQMADLLKQVAELQKKQADTANNTVAAADGSGEAHVFAASAAKHEFNAIKAAAEAMERRQRLQDKLMHTREDKQLHRMEKEIEFKKHAAEIGVSEAGADAAVNAAAAFGSSVGAQAGGVRDEQTRSRFTSHWMKAAAAGKGK